MNKKKKISITIISVILIMIVGVVGKNSDNKENNVYKGTSNTVNIQIDTEKIAEQKVAEEQRKLDEEAAKKAEELKKAEEAKAEQERIEAEKAQQARIEAEKAEQARIEEANRLEAERIQREAERIAEEQRQAKIAANNNFYVTDGVADHDHSTGYDSPYSDPNEPVITEEYGYIASGNSYIHKNPNCKFIRGLSVTQVPVSSAGKASCNCWYY